MQPATPTDVTTHNGYRYTLELMREAGGFSTWTSGTEVLVVIYPHNLKIWVADYMVL